MGIWKGVQNQYSQRDYIKNHKEIPLCIYQKGKTKYNAIVVSVSNEHS